MRNMSFALTTNQIVDGSKTVTRRLGWLRLHAGMWVQPVRKCMGLRPGEKMEKIRAPLLVANVRRERLDDMLCLERYGIEECRKEGFPDMSPKEFVAMFCATHKGCTPDTAVTRIEFSCD